MIPVVWEEMLLNYKMNLGTDVVVQTWLSDASVLAVVQAGYKALAGSYNFWYLDCGQGEWSISNHESRLRKTDNAS